MLQFHDFTPERIEEVFSLYEKNEAYFQLATGQMATIQDVWHDVSLLPEGVSPTQHHVVLIDLDEQLVGILIYITAYPTADTLYIGLLLLNPLYQGRGLGATIVTQLQQELAPPLTKIRLVVLDDNVAAKRFWMHHGFVEITHEVMTHHHHTQRGTVLQFQR
ncbi:GNAT family N-acetyltransferase [Kurthia massiliensis]|uniref:GNAT family N-acetyltransferase n=1 Tax=Kurthia massiliensis TaxID=1033739 RepID=UPI0002886526|nr:GNAT family N-acetyltransferase [Kurthia massiliensis]